MPLLTTSRILLAAALLAPCCALAQEPAAVPAEALTLERAVELALARNERMAIAAGEREAARARLERARSALWPELDVTASRERSGRAPIRSGVPTSRDRTTASADITLPLWDARAWPLLRQARLDIERADLELRDERRTLVRDVVEAFLLTLSAEQVVQAAKRRLDLAGTALDDIRARLEAGLVSSNDATQVQLEQATSRRELTRAALAARTTRLELALLTASDANVPLVPPEEMLERAGSEPPPREALASRARENRADVAARGRLAEGLRAFAREPPLRFVPRLELGAGYDVSDGGGGDGDEDDDWQVALDVTWEVFDGGQRAAERSERSALADIADLQAQQLERAAVVEVDLALAELDSAREAVQQADAAVVLARANASEATELYRQGLRPAFEVASAGVQLFEAEVALVRERYALALAHVDLVAAAGDDPLTGEPIP